MATVAAAENPSAGAAGDGTTAVILDVAYEFSAPHFFDFTVGESDEEIRTAELWFESALSHAPSPFMPKIKVGRDVVIQPMSDFGEEASHHAEVSEPEVSKNDTSEIKPQLEVIPSEPKKLEEQKTTEENCAIPVPEVSTDKQKSCEASADDSVGDKTEGPVTDAAASRLVCTPMAKMASQSGKHTTPAKNTRSAEKIAKLIKNPSALRAKSQSRSNMLAKNKKPDSVKKDVEAKQVKTLSEITNLAQENQAVKRQKLEEGRSRQILNVKPMHLPHKSRPGSIPESFSSRPSTTSTTRKGDRKMYVRVTAAPFISAAELVQKFQSKTRELQLSRIQDSSQSNDGAPAALGKQKLTLTRPKEPELETSQRVRPVRVESTAELEEEMMAKIPKFKARPVNKKILEATNLPPLPRSTPHAPEFQEFHLETTARAHQHAETSSVASTESFRQNAQWKQHLREPPQLQTSLRARPSKVKSSAELELEELQKIPKFKAKPLNMKIFESKGELGIFCTLKKPITIPQEFHFATDERIPPANVVDMFDKLSICSEPRHDTQTPRLTRPNPFHLHTEERGAAKEKKFVIEVMQKQLNEEKARIPKACPYPYTTDFPVIPPKPEPKACTKPKPFQLESLVRHEEEMQREKEERQRLETEEAEMRLFKAQAVLIDDPIPLPERVRIPLTQVEEFNLQADHRAVNRAEFDNKVKEKEIIYKRYREESEAAKMMEDEKALKQMRRTMVPHARPVPKFDNPFCPHKSVKNPTRPKSPKLRVIQRMKTERQRQAAARTVTAPVSSAASNMR